MLIIVTCLETVTNDTTTIGSNCLDTVTVCAIGSIGHDTLLLAVSIVALLVDMCIQRGLAVVATSAHQADVAIASRLGKAMDGVVLFLFEWYVMTWEASKVVGEFLLGCEDCVTVSTFRCGAELAQ